MCLDLKSWNMSIIAIRQLLFIMLVSTVCVLFCRLKFKHLSLAFMVSTKPTLSVPYPQKLLSTPAKLVFH